jgi:D-ribulokinase
MRLYRDALGAELVTSDTAEPVLLGTAMVAAVAGGLAPDLFGAVERMAPRQTVHAADPAWKAAHDRAYRTYLDLFEVRNRIERDARALMATTGRGMAGAG